MRRKGTYLLCLLMAFALCAGLLSMGNSAQAATEVASGTCGENLTWVLDSDGLLTISGTGAMDEYSEESAPWYTHKDSLTSLKLPTGLTSIGSNAFYNCSGLIGSLVIPDGVTEIGDYAFSGCSNLTGSLVIPDGVTEIDGAFYNCSGLTGDLVIPDGVTEIGDIAFFGCSSLTGDLVIPDGVTSIGSRAFFGCSGLTGDLVIPDGVTSIGSFAFNGCSGLTGSLVIPDGVTSIGNYAFNGCSSLTGSLVIPDSVTSIGSYTFSGCSGLTGGLVIPDGVTSIGKGAFYGCSGLTGSLVIPDSVTSIGNFAFDGCSGLEAIRYGGTAAEWATLAASAGVPSGVQIITTVASGTCGGEGDGTNLRWTLDDEGTLTISGAGKMADYMMDMRAFGMETVGETAPWLQWMPTSIPSVFVPELVIEEGVTTIGDYAFNIALLLSASIPDSVISIGAGAFSSCMFLPSITIPDSVTAIGDYAFQNCSYLTDVSIPSGVTSIGVGAFAWCSGLTNISVDAENPNYCSVDGILYSKDMTLLAAYPAGKTETAFAIPDSVTTLGGYAFSGCSCLTSITIPDSVTYIDWNAFYGCSGLTEITIPDSVTEIGNSVFRGCSGLTSITIPDSVTYIGPYAFYGCSGLTSVTIPDSVTEIGNFAFDGCSGLTSVTIPDSVTFIGTGAFPAATHLLHFHAAMDATCTTDGNTAYYACNHCTKFFSDAAGTTEIAVNSWVISAAGHSLTEHKATDPTCTADGSSAYWACSACEKFFSDADATTEIDEDSWIIAAAGHDLTEHKSVDATCTAVGNTAYWSCSVCGKFFSDAGCTSEIAENSWVIPMLPTIQIGDTDGNGTVSAKDAIVLARYLAGWSGYTADPSVCDLNGDFEVSSKDYIILARHLAHWTGYETLPYLG